MKKHEIPMVSNIKEKMELIEYLESLSDQDLINFNALAMLPGTIAMLENCPDEKYKRMMLLAIKLRDE